MTAQTHARMKVVFIGLISLLTLSAFSATARPPHPMIAYRLGPLGGPFHLYTMDIDGSDVRQLTDAPEFSYFDWSPDGTRLVLASFQGWLATIGCDGSSLQPLPLGAIAFPAAPAWSPDGTEIAFQGVAAGQNVDIFVLTLTSGNVRKLTDHGRNDEHPTWSPDGKWIAFTSNRDPNFWLHDLNGELIGLTRDIYLMDTDGNHLQNLTQHPADDHFPAWSPDGRQIAFVRRGLDTQPHIHLLDVSGGSIRRLTNFNKDKVHHVGWSPDSQQLIFDLRNTEEVRSDIYVMDRQGNKLRQLTHSDPGILANSPSWFGIGLNVSPVGLKQTVWGEVKQDKE